MGARGHKGADAFIVTGAQVLCDLRLRWKVDDRGYN